VRLIGSILIAAIASSTYADIYQWHDGDGNGSLWLSNTTAESYTDLSSQLLWWADLESAILHHSNLSYANLSYANFAGANIAASNLSYANLFDSNLENTSLAFSTFKGANLSLSNIKNANMFNADFSDADLSELENWSDAFWLASTYTANTIFPDGMDPDDFGMVEIEIPTPGVLYIAWITLFNRNRRK
jgi:hypothetical protein